MNKPFLCTVDNSYLMFLRKTDPHVPQKSPRPYVANVIELGGFLYAIPLTSQIVPSSGKPRSNRFTSFVPNSHGKIISAMLYNNMIPVTEKNISRIDIKNEPLNSYLIDEAAYARSQSDEIAQKATKVYLLKEKGKDDLCNIICCNFKELEGQCRVFNHDLNEKVKEKGPHQ